MLKHFWLAILSLTLAAAVAGGFTSHKYDCFNIGPCRGDVDFWIALDGLATYSFLGLWFALFIVTLAWSRAVAKTNFKISMWSVAVIAPPTTALAAAWFFNVGVKVATV